MGNPIKQIQKMVNGVATNITPLTDDNIKPADVINNLTSTATDKPLSANQGRELDYKISQLASIGRFLSYWDVQTGQPQTAPGTIPYEYKTGDFYRVKGVVDPEETKPPYYKPVGAYYDGNPSTTEETSTTIANEMIYYYDGSSWTLNGTVAKKVMFSEIIGDPLLNAELKDVFDTKLTHLGNEEGSGQPYHFPFNVTGITQESSAIKVDFDTLTLDGNNTITPYNFSLPLADPTNDKAGLWNASLSDLVDITVECDTTDYTLTGTVTPEQYAALKACKVARVTIMVGTMEVGKALATVYFDATPPGEMVKMFSALNPFQDGSRQLNGAYLTINDGATIAGHIKFYGNDIEVSEDPLSDATDIEGMTLNGSKYNFAVSKVGTTDVGTEHTPVYLLGGVPTVIAYTLGNACEKGIETTISSSSTDDNVPTSLAAYNALSNKLDKPTAITGGTNCKITYDSNGLITAGDGLAASDIPMLAISKITDLQTTLDGKLGKNAAITGATKCKITYDANGLVTAGEGLVVADLPDLTSAKTTAMTGYGKATTTSSILQTDTLNEAVGKLERALDDKVDKVTDYGLAKITLNGTVTDAPTIYAMGSAGSNGQIQRYNATTGKMEWFSIPASMYLREPKTGDELGAITPQASINGEMRYCTADGVTYTSFKAGNFYLCASNGTAYNWYSIGSFIDLSAYQLKNLGTANKAVQTDASGDIAVSSYTLGAACEKGVATSISSTGTDLPTSATVYQYAFDYLVLKNAPITGATKCKLTYDAKGLVTAGADLDAADIPNIDGSKTTSLTGYTKASAQADIVATDSLLVALGKLEKKIDDVLANYVKVKTS